MICIVDMFVLKILVFNFLNCVIILKKVLVTFKLKKILFCVYAEMQQGSKGHLVFIHQECDTKGKGSASFAFTEHLVHLCTNM